MNLHLKAGVPGATWIDQARVQLTDKESRKQQSSAVTGGEKHYELSRFCIFLPSRLPDASTNRSLLNKSLLVFYRLHFSTRHSRQVARLPGGPASSASSETAQPGRCCCWLGPAAQSLEAGASADDVNVKVPAVCLFETPFRASQSVVGQI